MEHDGESGQLQAPHWTVGVYERLVDYLPESRRGRLILAGLVTGVVLAGSIALLLLPIWFDMSEENLSTFGYSGVFFSNLLSTSTVFIPVPGVTVASQALIVSQSTAQNWIIVGVLGGVGMGLGEITAYVAGAAGSQVAREGNIEAPRLVRPLVLRTIDTVKWLMARFGFLTLFILSAIPDPVFEVAGITAGAVRMAFWRFMTAVIGGSLVRGLVLAYAGHRGFDIPYFT